MRTMDGISEALFGGSNPGGKFLLCLVVYIPLIMLKDHFRAKMNDIARKQDPTLLKDNPFTRVLLNNTEVWTNPEWRELRTKQSLAEYISFVPMLLGMWFGFESVVLILGNVFGW